MKKILVPTDFSLPARWALEAAIKIAERADASLVLLHVIEHPVAQSFNAEGEVGDSDRTEENLYTLKLIERQRFELQSWVSDFQPFGVGIIPVLRIGNVFEGISKIISEQDVDLVVMGTTGNSLWEKLFLGSNTDKVIRLSNCPVLTVHWKPSTNIFKNIVFATSLEDCESSFANVIKATQVLYDATIHLVRVNTPDNFSPDHEVKKHFGAFVKKMGFKNYTINIFNDRNIEDGIVRFAESIQADLIGLAAHRRSLLVDILTGNKTGEIVGNSPRPVLTFVTK